MLYPKITIDLTKKQAQQLQMLGINLTDDYKTGQLESCANISTERYPYITTSSKKLPVDVGIAEGYQPISIFAWEKLFVVSDEPSPSGGYKCFYDGKYCGDAVNTTIPKQYAVLNSKLVMFPDKVYFNLYDNELQSHPLNTAPLIKSFRAEKVQYRKAVR